MFIIFQLPINILMTETDSNYKNVYFFDTIISEKGGKLSILFNVTFAESDLKLNLDAPQKWSVSLSTNSSGWTAAENNGELLDPILIKFSEGNETHEVRVILDIVACKTTECISKKVLVVYRVHQKPNAFNVVTERKEIIVK